MPAGKRPLAQGDQEVRVRQVSRLHALPAPHVTRPLAVVFTVIFVASTIATADDSVRENHFLPDGSVDVDWTFIRGPKFNGHSDEIHLADSWPAAGPPVVWSRALGQGFSAMVTARGRVFTQYQTLAGQYLACLSAETGESIWEYRYAWPYEPAGLYPGPRATPTVAADRIYFASPEGHISCLSWDGNLQWSVDLYQRFKGKPPGFGYACSPVILDTKVIVPVGALGSSIVALDSSSGETVWQAGDDSASYTPVLPITLGGRQLLIGYLENALVCHDATDGRQLWRIGLSHGYDEHAAWPIFDEPWLWIAGPFQSGSRLLRLDPEHPESYADVWQSKVLSNDVFSSVCEQGFVYGFDIRDVQAKVHRPSRGKFRCIELTTGEEKWSTDKIGHAGVIGADGKLFLLTDQGELILVRADAEQFQELGRAQILGGEIAWTPPTLSHGRLYARNHSEAVCLYVGDPEFAEKSLASRFHTLADLPVRAKARDWTAILGVEPTYAQDLPSEAWLWRWFIVGVQILIAAEVLALIGWGVMRRFSSRSTDRQTRKLLVRILTIGMAAVGTTVLSRWEHDFVFTWPLVLLVLFQGAVDATGIKVEGSASWSAVRARLPLMLLLLGCAGYYFACRRLGLATEWAFLCGFAGALPFSLLRLAISSWRQLDPASELVLNIAEFSGFFSLTVAVLYWFCAR